MLRKHAQSLTIFLTQLFAFFRLSTCTKRQRGEFCVRRETIIELDVCLNSVSLCVGQHNSSHMRRPTQPLTYANVFFTV